MTREEKLSGGFSFTEDPLEDVDDLEDLNKLRDDLGMGGRSLRKISPLTLGFILKFCRKHFE
jgi:hypothetical protein